MWIIERDDRARFLTAIDTMDGAAKAGVDRSNLFEAAKFFLCWLEVCAFDFGTFKELFYIFFLVFVGLCSPSVGGVSFH
ncbi:hypothetical protein V6Z11_D11G261800 [Gossypium hirsutum]